MNKRTIVLALVLLLIGSIACSAEVNPYLNMINEGAGVETGMDWISLDSLSKLAYVKGLSFGITWGGLTVLQQFNSSSDKDKENATKVLDEIVPKVPYAEIVEFIDEFYKNPLNRALSITVAYNCMAFKHKCEIDKKNRDELLQKTNSANKY